MLSSVMSDIVNVFYNHSFPSDTWLDSVLWSEIIQEKKRKRKDEGKGRGGVRYLRSNATDPSLTDGQERRIALAPI